MKFYLSSYKLGNQTEKLKKLIPAKQIGYIPNALDFSTADPARIKVHIENDLKALRALGLTVEIIDLRDYFDCNNKLKNKLLELKAIFISGGNVFVLRQAMKLARLDEFLKSEINNHEFVYACYSAAGCVLAPTLTAYKIVDDSTETPYQQLKDVIWDGLGLLDFAFMPHWKSDHPESADIDQEIIFCEKNKIPYKSISDGEVLIIE